MMPVAFDRSFHFHIETERQGRLSGEDTGSGKVLPRKERKEEGKKKEEEETRKDKAYDGLGVLGDGSMMDCGGSGDGGIL